MVTLRSPRGKTAWAANIGRKKWGVNERTVHNVVSLLSFPSGRGNTAWRRLLFPDHAIRRTDTAHCRVSGGLPSPGRADPGPDPRSRAGPGASAPHAPGGRTAGTARGLSASQPDDRLARQHFHPGVRG